MNKKNKFSGKTDHNPRKRISTEKYESIIDINKNQSKKLKEYLQIGFFICNGIYNNSPIYIGARNGLFYINNHDSKNLPLTFGKEICYSI